MRLDAFIIFMLHSCQMSSVTCLLHLLLLFSLNFVQVCCAIDTISLTEPLQDPNFIVSSGATFKLGFFSPENTTNRYVGIMFNNVAKSTVVWVANRGNPLDDSSGVLTISEDGNLVVLNREKEILWSSNVENSLPNSSAQLLDDGNLILRNSSNRNSMWESFQHPTDTFLQGMKIGVSGNSTIQLASWRSQSDPSNGSFILGVNSQPIPEIFVWNEDTLYWRSGPWDGNIFTGIPGMTSDYQNRFDLDTEYFTFENKNTSSLMHYELHFSGVIEQKILNEQGGWNVLFSSGTSECEVYAKCGPNGLCDSEGSPICSCLKGFKPKDEEEWTKGNWSGGCIRNTLLQCDQKNSSLHEDGYLRFTNVKLPHLSDLIQIQEDCDEECLKNCSCSAYTYVVGIGCLHWGENLMDIQQYSAEGPDLYIRVAYSELDADHGMSKQKKTVIISTTVSVGCIFLVVLSYILWNWLIKHRGAKQEAELSLMEAGEVWNKEMMISGMSDKSRLEELPLYSYDTLAKATGDFHLKNRLGQGGFGPVYKGKLLTGQGIAVKRLSNSSTQGIKEFMNEVMVISKLQHRNLVRLLGCCVERAEKMLVYEYMSNKSLDGYLFDSQKQNLLDWKRRCAIFEGIGRGLLYLHKDSRLRIIHRDLKASNILLDEELNPKISDFGLARIFGGKQDQANTNRIVGTYGYMAPEYAMGGKFSEKSDVYSFGVLLLEIAIGKRNTSFYDDEENLNLLEYAWKLWNGSEAVNMAFTEKLDPRIGMEVKRCIQVGLLCVQDSENDRPDMFNVLVMLNSDIRDLPNPKLPFYTAAFPLSHDHFNVQSGQSVNGVSMTDVHGR